MIKSFVITKIEDPISERMADNCIKSGKLHNLDIEKFYGIYGNDIDNVLAQEKLFLNPHASKKIKTKGIIGCLLSHYSLWKKCKELNVPIAVFEYDAMIINHFPEDILTKFDDYLNLDFSRHENLKDIELYESTLVSSNNISIMKLVEDSSYSSAAGFKYMNRNHIKGAFGYIIKPHAAAKLILGIQTDGIIPADIAPNLKYINLHYTVPSIARLNPEMLQNRLKISHTKRD